MKNYKIAVAGTGYVGLSLGVLFAQHHQVVAVDIVQAKVDMINNKKSPIQDDYIEKYLAEKDLNLTATLDAKAAYSDADFVVIAAPTNYDSKTQHFDTSAVEAVIKLVMEYAIYYCPHHPHKGYDGERPELKIDCDCRKPKPGMLLKAASDFNIDLSQSWMVGDGENDIKAGINAGCKTALIGNGKENLDQMMTVNSLLEFAKKCL